MGLKQWTLSEVDRKLVSQLSGECGINYYLAYIAVSRGMRTKEEITDFLNHNPKFGDPYKICDVDKAVNRIKTAIKNREFIAVYGDYDCDGVTSTAILYSYLKETGANATYYIPNRLSEGYGMNCAAIDYLNDIGVNLIITVDNGINAVCEVEYAKSLGIDVVVTDHHLPQKQLPKAIAVVDPHRKDDKSGYEQLAGVGVVFKLVCALSGKNDTENVVKKYGAFAALGTIGDVVPLSGENRTICKYGIELLKDCDIRGINALKERAFIDKKKLNSSLIPFSLVPRINAAGRMGDSRRAVELLLSCDAEKSARLAKEIDDDNRNRQLLGEQIFSQAVEQIERDGLSGNRVIIAENDGWHSGIVGIVASRIVEKYNRPCILMARDGELFHGSGRSLEGFNLFEAVSAAKHLTEKFGGHELAVGVTLKADNFCEFYKEVEGYSSSVQEVYPKLFLDCLVAPETVNLQFAESLKELEPFGAGNEIPVFGIYGLKIVNITPLKGGKYVKITVKRDKVSLTALCFGYTIDNFPFYSGDNVDMAFSVDVGEFRGKKQVSLLVKGLRPHGIREDEYFKSISAYYNFISERDFDIDLVKPDRNEFAVVFSVIKCAGSINEEALVMRNTVSAGKIKVILSAFLQLGLIEYEDNKYKISKNTKKVCLESAEVMLRLRQKWCENGEL